MTASIKRQAFLNTSYLLAGQGAGQVIRLVGNLVLTRLLTPELFGLMAIVNVLLMAFVLFSDIGATPSVVRSPRGLDPKFLNTAWTLQVFRGALLWFCTILVARPVAWFYGHYILVDLIPIAGLSLFISGFNSMALAKLEKNMKLGRVVVMDVVTSLIGILFIAICAYFFRSIWVLVIGKLVSSFVRLIWSFFLDTTIRHSFMLDSSVCVELFQFGKWIIFSTALIFAATQIDRILLGKFLPITLFGVYSIALTMAEFPKNMVNSISGRIIFPLISMYRYLPRQELFSKLLRKRKWLLVFLAPLVAITASCGDMVIDLLYDDRYQQAGWMLSFLALGMWPLVLCRTIDRLLYVIDNPKYIAFGNMCKIIYMVTVLPLAVTAAGHLGAVVAVALNDIPGYIIVNYGLVKLNLTGLHQDAWASALLIFLISVILFFRFQMGIGLPWQGAFV